MGTSRTTFNFMSIFILVFLVSYGICTAAGDVQAVEKSAADLQRVEVRAALLPSSWTLLRRVR
ncbi:hypothetical protein KP509_1Z150000 [Ceratopteris richardii]|nr:hypothetical protein KP509_1Z184900 [Ceratopteris richardii]KAH6556862.1 hypothetical protein KP509_1Z150000 [Ceratopteris richardii]